MSEITQIGTSIERIEVDEEIIENIIPFNLNISSLIETRLLCQANSGGGKSYLLRKILEVTQGKIQQIVIDLEGEFSSLRSSHDYLIVGKGGDIEIDLKISTILPKKIIETGISTILDISELKQHERRIFVKRFLESLLSLPKKYWKPVLVVIDEAHQFAPEKGKAESAPAVIDLMTRGRKRGYTGLLATQRLSKLSKDASAECNNVLIGRTGQDIDMKRASDTLGFSSKQDMLKLRSMNPGTFYAFGPAFKDGVTQVQIGKVKTHHPKVGSKDISYNPKPTAYVKKILSKLQDIQTEAVKELQDINDYRNEIKKLRTQLTIAKKDVDIEGIKQKSHNNGYVQGLKEGKSLVPSPVVKEDKTLKSDLTKAKNLIEKHIGITEKVELRPTPVSKKTMEKLNTRNQPSPGVQFSDFQFSDFQDDKLGRCDGLIYAFLLSNPNRSFSRVQIGAMTGYSPKSGGFNNSISKLNSMDLIIRNNDTSIQVNHDNLKPEIAPEGKEFNISLLKNKLGKCENEIFEVLLNNPNLELSREMVANMTVSQYSHGSGGFNNAISKLNSLGCIKRGNGVISLSEDIKEMMNDAWKLD